MVHTVLLETGLAANRLELEITEGVLIGDFTRALSILRRLKALGVRIAMDDFGTGYSSLSYLQSFPFDKIKIDQSFVSNLDRSPQSAAIIRAVIGLGRGLDLPVIAEGVETAEQLAFLTDEACNEVQGYLVGRPLPIADYAELVGRAPVPVRIPSVAGGDGFSRRGSDQCFISDTAALRCPRTRRASGPGNVVPSAELCGTQLQQRQRRVTLPRYASLPPNVAGPTPYPPPNPTIA